MAVTPQFLDEIRSRVSVSSLIGQRVKLQKRGTDFTGLCPFHNEKTPSFHVVDTKEFYHCFGCGEHGDIFSYLMKIDGLTFMEAVETLAGRAGMTMPTQTHAQKQQQKQRLSLYEVCELACQYFQKSLREPIGAEAFRYVESRKISPEMQMHFRLGYAPNTIGIIDFLKQNSVEDSAIIEAGLAGKNSNGLYSFFRDRVIFPIMDIRGRVIAFGGRFMGDSKQAGVGKYINSPQTPLFDKSNTLYNLKNMRNSAKDAQYVIVAEGYMDVIALTQFGFTASVAPLGTALTEQQILQIWKSCDEPVLCFDGDSAGQKAAMRGCERILPLLSAGKSVAVSLLPTGTDPDDILQQQGKATMHGLINNASPLVRFIWNEALQRFPTDTPEKLAQLERYLMDTAGSISDENVSKNYKSLFNTLIWDTIKRPKNQKNYSKGNGFGRQAYGHTQSQFGMLKTSPMSPAENRHQQKMLAFLLDNPAVFSAMEEKFSYYFASSQLQNILQTAQEVFYDTDTAIESGQQFQDLILQKNPVHQDIVEKIISDSTYLSERRKFLNAETSDICRYLQNALDLKTGQQGRTEIKAKIKQELQKALQDPDADPSAVQKIIDRLARSAAIEDASLYPDLDE